MNNNKISTKENFSFLYGYLRTAKKINLRLVQKKLIKKRTLINDKMNSKREYL